MFLLVLSAQLIVVTPVAGGAAGRANAGLAACIRARVETQHHSPEHGKSPPPPQCCAVASAPADKSLCRDRASPPQLLTNNRKPQRISILARRRRDQ